MCDFTEEQKKRLLNLINMTDFEFYERYLADLPLEEQAAFMSEFPEFLDEETLSDLPLNEDEVFQKIIDKIKESF